MKELDKAIAAVLGQDVFDGLKAARVWNHSDAQYSYP